MAASQRIIAFLTPIDPAVTGTAQRSTAYPSVQLPSQYPSSGPAQGMQGVPPYAPLPAQAGASCGWGVPSSPPGQGFAPTGVFREGGEGFEEGFEYDPPTPPPDPSANLPKQHPSAHPQQLYFVTEPDSPPSRGPQPGAALDPSSEWGVPPRGPLSAPIGQARNGAQGGFQHFGWASSTGNQPGHETQKPGCGSGGTEDPPRGVRPGRGAPDWQPGGGRGPGAGSFVVRETTVRTRTITPGKGSSPAWCEGPAIVLFCPCILSDLFFEKSSAVIDACPIWICWKLQNRRIDVRVKLEGIYCSI